MSSLQAHIDLPTVVAIVAVAAPLVAIPLTMVIFHLRSMREHQTTRQNDLARRVDTLGESVASAGRRLMEVQRDYATKEEWLRESVAARHHIEQLLEAVARLETEIDVVRGWSRHIESRIRDARACEAGGAAGQPEAKATQSEQC